MSHRKTTFSTLWVFVMFNMVFADIVGFMSTGALERMIAMKPAQELLLVIAFVLEIPIAMIVLSRLLPYRANRWANIVAGVITILWVVGGGSTDASYIFFQRWKLRALHSSSGTPGSGQSRKMKLKMRKDTTRQHFIEKALYARFHLA